MRVLHIISGDLWAGAEVMARHLLNGLRAIGGMDLSVIVLNEGRLATELRAAGHDVHVLDESRTSFSRIVVAARRILASRPPDIIHSHRYKENILSFLASRSHPGITLLTTQHGLPESRVRQDHWSGKLKAKANLFVLSRYFRKIVAVSGDVRDYYINELGFPADRVPVIHNGIELPETVSMKATNRDFVIGSSGRLFPVKDYPLMIRIAQELAGESDIRMALAGDGPERGVLENAIDACGLGGRFSLKGHLEDIGAFYGELDLYLNTSLHEGLPMAVLEAMARGLPVVAPRIGGLAEVIDDGVDGYLVAGRAPESFAKKCLLLKEGGRRRRMGEAARRKVEGRFSADHMARRYGTLYRDLVR